MNSKENSLIEVKETFWGKLVNNVKSFFLGIFSRKENLVEEISTHNEEKGIESSVNKESFSNNVAVEQIDISIDDKLEEKELSLQEKLEKLIKENQELEATLNNKFEELKKIRIKELKITLEIYKIEETYLKKYKMKISV